LKEFIHAYNYDQRPAPTAPAFVDTATKSCGLADGKDIAEILQLSVDRYAADQTEQCD
jgi:hypothetical protein